ncbi:TIM barrel protein [Croceicoccus sp. F390]|uniref:TIM barrel protein n=1 Tax=Croceicoccus esteveae TaxID=3075597 RepID=A0ABU2ZHL1_9SPHN|nr:TIM barrel protein [Croceicoccus sp. F390]MDT0575880.1 TIM barrel protein [Croceicoccus sp. F390]
MSDASITPSGNLQNGLQLRERVLYAGSCQSIAPADRFVAAHAAGFTAVTLFTSDVMRAAADGLEPEALRAAMDDAGLKLESYEIVGNWIAGQDRAAKNLPGEIAAMLLSKTPQDICRTATTLGARSVTLADLFGVPFDLEKVGAALREVCIVAADHGLGVAVELIPGSCIGNVAQAAQVLGQADCTNAGLLIDSWHFFRSGSKIEDVASLPPEWIMAWQMNDASLTPMRADPYEDMMTRLMPGEGAFDLAALMQAIAATGARAAGGIEVFSPSPATPSASEIASRSATALDYCISLAGATR